jgi:hypothetical protein
MRSANGDGRGESWTGSWTEPPVRTVQLAPPAARLLFRQTCKTELTAQIELGKLLEQVTAGRQPESGATVAQLLDQYVQVTVRESPGPQNRAAVATGTETGSRVRGTGCLCTRARTAARAAQARNTRVPDGTRAGGIQTRRSATRSCRTCPR